MSFTRTARHLGLAAVACGICGGALGAQVIPNARWQTMHTEHFHVHFTAELEEQARRAAANAEHAYERLAAELVPPRGPIDLVVADNVDFTNGLATTFPSNRIIIYANPPVSGRSLRFYEDWNALVIAHELTHIFHLDRSRGIWRVLQRVFGRNPLLFPNQYAPAWVSEGIAVYYESRLTGAGRIHGTDQRMLARASALEGDTPRLDQLSIATPRFPGGQAAYVYGGLLFDHLARTRGPEGVREFIERSSALLVPFRLDHAARRSFGVTLHHAWREWRDSVEAEVAEPGLPLPEFRELTPHGWYALHPRWLGDSAIVYGAATGKETAAAYRVGLDGRVRRLGRRNGVEPNVPLADGSLLFAQLEFLSPYVIRSDLWIDTGEGTRRLTRGARLSFPDARADGAIVAVAAVPGTTRLVRVDAATGAVTPLTVAHPDTQWTDPRWSPAGDRIAAVRWTRGAYTSIVVLDTAGAVRRVITRDRAVNATPSWTRDGSALLFTSDRDGKSDIYLAPVDARPATGRRDPAPPVRLSRAATGVFFPELSPDGTNLASVLFRADGYHVGVSPFEAARAAERPARRTSEAPPPEPDMPELFDGPAHPYSPWRQLLPRYWFPIFRATSGVETMFGGSTSSYDVAGRHVYWAQALAGSGLDAYEVQGGYRYRGLGVPVLDLYLLRSVEGADTLVFGPEAPFFRREATATLAATLERPRFRTHGWLQLGAELEHFEYRSEPDSVRVASGVLRSTDRRGVVARFGWTNAQWPPLGISPEDGVSLGGWARHRWLLHLPESDSRSAVGIGRGYRSLDLGGFAHHVLALRLAGGYADSRTTTAFEVGGVHGAPLELLPGYAVGERGTLFGVRGYPAEAQIGIRAVATSLEYRAPLAVAGRGLKLLPLFFDRTSLTLFGDAGTAWCPAADASRFFCGPDNVERRWLVSAGGELNLDAALFQYDAPYRFRLGAAAPLTYRELAQERLTLYLTLGLSF